jgi:Holliday junction resolvase RusA-like endonuclease
VKTITLVIKGDPVARKEPGFSGKKHGKKGYSLQTAEKAYYRHCIEAQYKGKPIDGPVKASFEFVFAVPKSYNAKKRAACLAGEIEHSVKPDYSNCLKFVEDCIKGIVITDDCKISRSGEGGKSWGENPGTVVKIVPL